MKYLLTGGTGSWGKILTQKLLENPDTEEIKIFSRNEYNQVMMKRTFNNSKLTFIVGDVRDYEAIKFASKNVNTIFHLAAIKHVPICENQPEEAIKTNIIGTKNIINASISQGVNKVIDVSSDKAVSPNTLYGMTKAVGEKLILHANQLGQTSFVCIRAGNVLGSAGSVVPLFIDQIKTTNIMTVTDSSMTRYFMSLPEAISLLLIAANAPGGSLLVMKMPSCTIEMLAKTMRTLFGNKNTEIVEIGTRESEKKHELLINEDEAPLTYIYSNNYYIISNNKLDLPKVSFSSYGSNTQELMNEKEITEMLKQGGFYK